ncbi:hypothetical protein TNCV_797991 [Trichonephila clavipes]|nr:hypothetical protein TNCV_797991 [Trichonephila clavipes]
MEQFSKKLFGVVFKEFFSRTETTVLQVTQIVIQILPNRTMSRQLQKIGIHSRVPKHVDSIPKRIRAVIYEKGRPKYIDLGFLIHWGQHRRSADPLGTGESKFITRKFDEVQLIRAQRINQHCNRLPLIPI